MRISIGEIIMLQLLAITLFSIKLIHRKIRKMDTKNEWIYCLFYMYIAGLLSITILPIQLPPNPVMELKLSFFTNFRPFKEISQSISTIGDAYSGDFVFHIKLITKTLLGNIIILIPFGIFGSIMKKKQKNIFEIVLTGFSITLAIELSQLLMAYTGYGMRIFDVDDLILNTIGYILGYYLMQSLLTMKLFNFLEERLY